MVEFDGLVIDRGMRLYIEEHAVSIVSLDFDAQERFA